MRVLVENGGNVRRVTCDFCDNRECTLSYDKEDMLLSVHVKHIEQEEPQSIDAETTNNYKGWIDGGLTHDQALFMIIEELREKGIKFQLTIAEHRKLLIEVPTIEVA